MNAADKLLRETLELHDIGIVSLDRGGLGARIRKFLAQPDFDTEANPAGFGQCLEEMDVEAFLNLREWLSKAVTGAGAKLDGGAGIGMGRCCWSITRRSRAARRIR